MDIRDYTATADTLCRVIQARKALASAFESLSAALGLPGADGNPPAGDLRSVKGQIAAARHDAQRAADALHALATMPADLDPTKGGAS
jgi:hypothetical protein